MKRSWTADDVLPAGGPVTLRNIATTDKGMVIEAGIVLAVTGHRARVTVNIGAR
jgi:hypothetical protein